MPSASATTESRRLAAASVAELKLYHVRIPLRKVIRHASHTRDSSDNVVVECRLDDGTVGFGEGLPRDYVTGETIDGSIELLRQTDWTAQLEAVADFESAVAMVRRFTVAVPADDVRGCLGNAARCAAEIALLDAFGQRFGICLSKLPTYDAGWRKLYAPRKFCRYSGAITSKSRASERLAAGKQWAYGMNKLKVKVGSEGQDDVARLKIIRRLVGRRFDIRVDANEAWTPENVVAKIRELEPFGISAVEQPVSHENVDCLSAVRKQVAPLIMLDESLCSRYDAERAIERGLCDLFNIRISKCGGLTRSLDLAALAADAGLGYQLGCQVGETGILSAAGRHFGCSVANIRYLEGSYDQHLVKEWLTKQNLTFGWFGRARAIGRPGLGIEVDPQKLERVTLHSETIHG